jgi:hypothetical protein
MAALPAEYISAAAAVVSAIGGAFAAVAAFRSAASARDAREAAQVSEKRAALRQLTLTAAEVLVEEQRVDARAADLKSSYRDLFTFAGQSAGGKREGMLLSEIEKKITEVTKLSNYAKPFTSESSALRNGPLEEINIREIKLAQKLTQVRAIREDLEREQASVEGQCTTFRERALRGPTGS